MNLVYDAGALIAAEQGNHERFLALHREAVRAGILPIVPAGVLGQVWRGTARQARIAKLLQAARVVPLDEPLARAAGVLCGHAGHPDIIDASVVAIAVSLGTCTIVTSDPGDIRKLLDACVPRPNIRVYEV